jgi:hypothetical protein
MKRRWKVGIALAVVGVAGFIVLAFLSDPHRGVAIIFLGYETNGIKHQTFLSRFASNGVSAHFCLTNGSDRAIVCDAFEGSPLFGVSIKTNGGWKSLGRNLGGGLNSFQNIVLPPTKSTCFSVPVPDLSWPMRVTVHYSTNVPPLGTRGWVIASWSTFPMTPTSATNAVFATIKSRVSSWLGWDKRPPSVSITIQER